MSVLTDSEEGSGRRSRLTRLVAGIPFCIAADNQVGWRAYPETDRQPEQCLWFSIRALGEITGRLLKGSKGHPTPLRQKAADAHRGRAVPGSRSRTGGRARRYGPRGPKAPGPMATAGSGAPRGSGSSRALVRGPTGTQRHRPWFRSAANHLRSPFGPRSSGGISTRPRVPNVRASATAGSVASQSRAAYTRPTRRNRGSHAGYQPPLP